MIYLDHNATTPPYHEVVVAMADCLSTDFGNPSSVHRLGSRARCAVEDSRDKVAALVGAAADEIVFTSGGTESNNLALQGVARSVAAPGHIVASPIEHSSVLDTVRSLERVGWSVSYAAVDAEGRVSPEAVAAVICDDTRLVTVGWANNEIGTVQPIAEIADVCRKREILLHVDAVQAVAKLPVSCLCVDLLSLSAHKIGGPKGVGALYVRRGSPLRPIQLGGGQERGRRAGTENVAGIVGFGVAATLAERTLSRRGEIEELRERLWNGIAGCAGARRNSPETGCLANTLNVSFAAKSADALVAGMDLRGVAVSSGSACAAGASEPSHVLLALGRDPRTARDSLRFSLGPETTGEEIREVVAAVSALVDRKAHEHEEMVGA